MEECQRCQEPSVLISRSQNFCADCFIKFIRGKHRKSIQAVNSNRNEIVKIVLPINFDLRTTSFVNFNSAITLLDIIINYSKDVYKSYFNITLLFLVEDQTEDTVASARDSFQKIKLFYNIDNMDLKILDLLSFIKINKKLYHISIINNSAISEDVLETENSAFPESFHEYIEQIKNTSTREDILFNVYWNIIKIYAYLNQISFVLFSNSMNNIATKILSNIVKGKSLEISQILSERQSLKLFDRNNEIDNTLFTFTALYPSKEVLNTEVLHYIKFLRLTQFLPDYLQYKYKEVNDLETGINNKVINVKMATINQLVNEYFNDLEKNGYSTIVSTVVSTGSRLALPKNLPLKECPLCHFKHPGNTKEWLDNITVNSSYEEGQKILQNIENENSNQSSNEMLNNCIDVCYGCLLSFTTVGDKFTYPSTDNISMQDKAILDEYVLSEGD